jgi:hypothetical protein
MNNRQANGRRRGRGGQRTGNPGRPENGNRIDNRARGNAAQLLEKYKNLASDAQRAGDRVNTEYYLQFADHYFRVLAETRSRFEEQNQNQNQNARRQRDDNEGNFEGGDDDYGYEGEVANAGAYQQRDDRDAPREGRDEGRGQSRDQNREGRDQNREGRDQNRDQGRDREARRDDRPALRSRVNANPNGNVSANGNVASRGYDVEGEDAGDRPVAAAAPAASEERAETPRPRRGRPRREDRPVEAKAEAAPEAEGALIFDIDRLPPALSIEPTSTPAAAEGDTAEVERPRRTRRRRTADDEAVPPAA